MIEEISVGVVVAGAGYFIIRKILKQLAGDESENPCQGCTGCSMHQNVNPEQGGQEQHGCAGANHRQAANNANIGNKASDGCGCAARETGTTS